MVQGRILSVLAAALACSGCGSLGSVTCLSALSSDFDGEAAGSRPALYVIAETNGKGNPAQWGVAVDSASGGGGCMRLASTTNEGETFNLFMTKDDFVADLRISVRLRADAGVEDQGGGVFWRALGSDDYYVARWNPLEDNLRVYKVEHGVRSQFQSAKVVVEPGRWHDLVVTMQGDHMTVAFDGQAMLDHRDATFTRAGRVGLWTKADAATSFDDLVVEAL